MFYTFLTNRRIGAAATSVSEIHPAWCTCSGCSFHRPRDLRLDVGVMGLGLVCGLIAAASLWVGNF